MFKVLPQARNDAPQSAVVSMLQRIQNNVNLEANDEEDVVKNVAAIAYSGVWPQLFPSICIIKAMPTSSWGRYGKQY